MLSIIVITFVSVYIGFALLLFFFQERFVFHPYKDMESTPENAGLRYEDITLTTPGGLKINAWYVPAEKAEFTVLFCHGNAGNISHRLDTIRIFHELGFNTLIFDYRGYGKSEGTPSEKGSYEDAESAWNFLRTEKNIPAGKIIIDGRSLGGAVAAHLASEKQAAGLILESAFISVPDMASDMFRIFPARYLARLSYNTQKYLKKVKCPVIIIHSTGDEIVNFRHGKTLFENAPSPKTFIELSGSHNECYFLCENTYRQAIEKFVGTLQEKKERPGQSN